MSSLKYTIFLCQCGISFKCTISTSVYKVIRVTFWKTDRCSVIQGENHCAIYYRHIKSNTTEIRRFLLIFTSITLFFLGKIKREGRYKCQKCETEPRVAKYVRFYFLYFVRKLSTLMTKLRPPLSGQNVRYPT